MLEARSAIDAALAAGGRDGADGRRRLRLGERRGWHLVQISHFRDSAADLMRAVGPHVGGELPTSASLATVSAGQLLMRIAPDQYWVLGSDAARADALAKAVPGDAGAALDLTASRTCLVVEGASSHEMLMKLVPLDLHPDVFGVGAFAQTGIHHVGGLLHRVGPERYEYYALRTFALAMWEAIADAALPLGYDILPEGAAG